jgi:hypothetical protein
MTGREFKFQKRRELGEIISDSFEFLKSEIRPVFRLILPYVFPFVLLYGGLQVYVQMIILNNVDFSDPESLLGNIGPVYLNIFFSSLFAVFVQSLLVGTYYSYLEFYIKKGRNNIDFEEIKSTLFPNTLIALGANFVLYFLVILGVFMCILPGIYIANTLSPLVMVLFFERKNLSESIVRTLKLVQLQWWNTFVLNLLGIIIIYLAVFILTLPANFIAGNNQTIGAEVLSADIPDWQWVVIGISNAISALLWLIPYTFLAFQYFNLKERAKDSSIGKF